MNKISSIYSIGKSYIKNLFYRSAKKVEPVAAETVEQAIETPAKVTSKQIEAYYKRYERHLKTPIQKEKPKVYKQKKESAIDKIVQKECDAYNRIRYIDVSKEALAGLQHNFEQKKEKVTELILANSKDLPKEFIHKVKTIKTPEDLSLIIRSYTTIANTTLDFKYRDVIVDMIKKQKISLETQQKIFQEEVNVCNTYVELVKAVTEPSKDSRVIKIEDYIKRTYNMDFVHLESLEEAKRVLKTIDIAVKNNIPLPRQIIISPFTMLQANGANVAHNFSERTIILQPQKDIAEAKKKAYQAFSFLPQSRTIKQLIKRQDTAWSSTDDELQCYLHEFCHNKYFMDLLLPMKVKPIPAKYNNVAQNVGIYASSARGELDVELKTKSILRSLNKEEQELLNYFE